MFASSPQFTVLYLVTLPDFDCFHNPALVSAALCPNYFGIIPVHDVTFPVMADFAFLVTPCLLLLASVFFPFLFHIRFGVIFFLMLKLLTVSLMYVLFQEWHKIFYIMLHFYLALVFLFNVQVTVSA